MVSCRRASKQNSFSVVQPLNLWGRHTPLI